MFTIVLYTDAVDQLSLDALTFEVVDGNLKLISEEHYYAESDDERELVPSLDSFNLNKTIIIDADCSAEARLANFRKQR